MKWPWSESVKADKAELARSEVALAEARKQRAAVLVAAALMHAHRERNHFADSIATIYRGLP